MTHTLKRILVATDMSPRSDRAVERALQLGRTMSLPVDVLLILDNALPEDLLAPLHSKTEAQLEALCSRWAGGATYSVSVQAGDPTEEILKAAAPCETTLLVMGPHRPRPFLDGLRETTMQRVVRRTSAPVLLATIPVTGDYDSQLSLLDYSDVSTGALLLGASLAPGAEITGAHAIHIPYAGMLETTGSVQMDLQAAFAKDAEEQDRIWREETDLPDTLAPKTRLVQSPPLGLVHEMTKGSKFDLVTAGAHGRVGAARSYLGSIALDLMRDPPCDVLIARK
jgi:nucleotide-binding universal stress UspA family protein